MKETNESLPELTDGNFVCSCRGRRFFKASIKDQDRHLLNIFKAIGTADDFEDAQTEMRARSRERTLHEVIKLVSMWRKLQSGVLVRDNSGHPVKRQHTTECAARYLGMSKKTMDEYLHQLRYGEKLNFDFEAHLYHGAGVLRTFIKE